MRRDSRALLLAGLATLVLGSARVHAQDPPKDNTPKDTVPLPDRWRIQFPDWNRTVKRNAFDPYNQNPLKGDYAIPGTSGLFFSLTAISDTLYEARQIPVTSDVAAANPFSEEFFGKGDQRTFVQQVSLTLDLFHGSTTYKPVDWELRVTAAGNLNVLQTKENGIVNVNPARGTDRTDRFLGLQEGFGEVRLATVSPNFDFISARVGVQGFNSDFRGFIFNDNNLGARLFGTLAANRYQWNVAAFNQLEKDTNSGLNELEIRGRQIGIANFYAQDFLTPGYTTQVSFHYNHDKGERKYDNNGFLVRPAPIGTPRDHEQKVYYVGWTGDGHIGRLNINHAFYQALGTDEFDPIAGREVKINAQLAALELSIDADWLRYKISGLYQSGDSDPTDETARGFDSIFDNVNFAGGPFSFWNRQSIRLTQTGVALVNRSSLLNNLQSAKEEGQSEFVNPGLILANIGISAKLTPKLFVECNANYLRFANVEPVETVLFQNELPQDIGIDASLGFRYRPFLNDNAIFVLGAAALFPGKGFKRIYESNCDVPGCRNPSESTRYQAFASLTLTY
ncbi:MAG: hypothetical protein ABIT01_05005 [Thermoanaerobaculia bacterium]